MKLIPDVTPLFAYIDPGLGLLAWQAIVAACVGALFYLRKTRQFLTRPFRALLAARRRRDLPPQRLSADPAPQAETEDALS